eukprot:g29866.t1
MENCPGKDRFLSSEGIKGYSKRAVQHQHLHVMEDVIKSAIKLHLLIINLLSDTQFGFHQGNSAPALITTLIQTWAKELNSRGE